MPRPLRGSCRESKRAGPAVNHARHYRQQCRLDPGRALTLSLGLQITEIEIGALTATTVSGKRVAVTGSTTTNTSMTKLIVSFALRIVLKHFVCLVQLFEFGLVTALVRVVLCGCSAKGFLDFIGAGILADTEYFIVIAFRHMY